ncbi:MAG TPA: hypothetical protein VN654_00710 [Vicinamibacterales bacterium]|nr:hypothetical protein [Vicinamibacterales bacterium]
MPAGRLSAARDDAAFVAPFFALFRGAAARRAEAVAFDAAFREAGLAALAGFRELGRLADVRRAAAFLTGRRVRRAGFLALRLAIASVLSEP